MKIKRIFALLAAAAMMAAMSVTCFAVKDGEATYCFDTAARISDWEAYGSIEETGFKFKQTTRQSKNGQGSIVVSEDVTGAVEDGYGGVYVSAGAVGLSNFGGCTISMSVLLAESAENHHENLFLFSDGIIWLEASSAEVNSQTWTDIILEIPEDASNSKVGFTIPTFELYSGDVLYIDDFAITDAQGNAVANLGDYSFKNTAVDINTVPRWVNIVLTVVLVLLIVVIIGGIGMLVSSSRPKFH